MSDENRLYLISATDDDGEDQSVFVIAASPERAMQLWDAQIKEQGFIDEDEWVGEEIDYRVFRVPFADLARLAMQRERILEWFEDVEQEVA